MLLKLSSLPIGLGCIRQHPGSVQEAIANYRALFTDPNVAGEEAIFIKGYGAPGTRIAHDYDAWNNPNQNAEGFPHRGRTNPILELIDLYEDYTNPGHAAPIITTEDGKVSDNEGYSSCMLLIAILIRRRKSSSIRMPAFLLASRIRTVCGKGRRL